MQTALKRGVAYGILKKNGGHYTLSIGNNEKDPEIAEQELSLLDYCRRRSRQKKLSLCCKCKKRARRRRRSRKKRRLCSCKSKRKRRRRSSRRRSRRRRKSRGRCRSRRRRSRRRSRRRRRKLCTCKGRKRADMCDQLNEQEVNENSFAPEVEAKDSMTTVCSSVASTVSSVAN